MNILLTCAGRRNYLIHFFKEALSNRGKVFVTDTNAGAPSMQEADKAILVPTVYSPDYMDGLLSICQKHHVKMVIPLNDLELPILSAARERFHRIGTIPVVSSQKVIDICFDKWKTYLFATEQGVGSPKTFTTFDDGKNAIERNQLAFPLVIKPRWGTASISIDVVADLYEMELSYQLTQKRLPRTMLSQISSSDKERSVLIQEMLHGQEYGLDVLNDFNGKYVCTFVKRKLGMRAGETDKAITVDSDELQAFGRLIGEKLEHIGNLDCDVFVTEKGVYLLEMNPRFGGGYPFSHAAGGNIPAALIAWAKGEIPDPSWLKVRNDIASAKCDRLVVLNGVKSD